MTRELNAQRLWAALNESYQRLAKRPSLLRQRQAERDARSGLEQDRLEREARRGQQSQQAE